MDAGQVIERLGLAPLPEEGGYFAETYRDDRSTAILYLLETPDFSALHRLTAPELYHWHAGVPLAFLLLRPDGSFDEVVLGPDLAVSQQPQLVVPAGVWQGARPLGPDGAWSLVGTTMAPGFQPDMFELGAAAALTRGWPAAAERIARLVR
jgi:uncharacterized protein